MTTKFFISKNKYKILFLGISVVFVSSFFSLMLFSQQADIFMILLITLALSPLIYFTIKIEEDYDLKNKKEKLILKHHFSVLNLYMILFLGLFLGYILLYLLMPLNIVESIFKSQILTLSTSFTISSFFQSFISIFLNNFLILFLCFVLSLFYGTGALLILVWNASILATTVGDLIRISLQKGSIFGIHYFIYLTFIIPEILAYFIAGLAGGIISIATIRHHYKTKKFYNVIQDSTILIIISILLILFSALIEALII